MNENYLCKSPKVSVVIPVYNTENYLAKTIDSVLTQTFKDFELLIIDNCSTDASPDIAQKYAQKDDRIKFYRNDHNLGLIGNWNRAILLARGDYVKLLCADDILEPDHLQEFLTVLDTHPDVSLVTSFEQLIGDLHTVRKVPDLPAINELNGKLVQKHLMTYGNWIGSPSSVMFRRKSLYIGVFNYMWSDWVLDLDMWIRLLSIGNLFVVPKILTHNRIHNQRTSATTNINYNFVNEELLFLKTAFQFPKIYGSFTKKEQDALYKDRLTRLISEGIGNKDLRLQLMMVQIGFNYGRIRFCNLLLNYLFQIIFNNRIIHQIKRLLPALDRFSLINFSLRKKFHYKYDPKNIDVGWGNIYTYGTIKIPLNILRANIYTPTGMRLVPIEETPHYQWINDLIQGNDNTDSYSKYHEYVKTFFPELNTDEQLDKIKNLVRSILSQPNKNSQITITVYTSKYNRNSFPYIIIFDGNHRAAIAKSLGYNFIQCRLVTYRFNNKDLAPNIFNGENEINN